MSKPLQPKDAKPKEEEVAQKNINSVNPNVMILANTIVTIIVLAVFMVIMYSLFDSMITKKISSFHNIEEQIDEEATNVEDERGMLLDLGDFILNLADIDHRRY